MSQNPWRPEAIATQSWQRSARDREHPGPNDVSVYAPNDGEGLQGVRFGHAGSAGQGDRCSLWAELYESVRPLGAEQDQDPIVR